MSLCRGNCGTELSGSHAPPSLYGICTSCLAKARSVDPRAAWTEVLSRRQQQGLDDRNISEMTEDYYTNEFVPGVETLQDQERYER